MFLAEGSSDHLLAPHLERLCVDAGAAEAVVGLPEWGRLARPPGHAVIDKVRALHTLQYDYDLLFVHRDADGRIAEPRHLEIQGAHDARRPCVGVVPVQALEAWLLHDEHAIRHAAGHPRGKEALDLPSASEIPRIADPKARLAEAIRRAQVGAPRRRLPKFAEARARLVERLDLSGEVRKQPSWQRLEEDVTRAIAAMAGSGG